MKTKILTVAALSAVFLINAAFAATGSLSLGYGSDFFRRGSLLSKDSLQAAASYSTQVQGVTASANVQTAHGNENLEDAYIISGGLSQKIGSLLTVYGGLEHAESLGGASELDAVVAVSIDTLLSPSISAARNVDEDLYTFELSVSHDLDLKFATLSINGSVGNTDTRSVDNVDYYSVGLGLSKELQKGLTLSVNGDFVDSSLIKDDFLIGAALTASF